MVEDYRQDVSEVPKGPRLVRRSEQSVDWNSLPRGKEFGMIRGIFRDPAGQIMTATSCKTLLVVMPFGQASPRHSSTGEHIILGVAGATEWDIDGDKFKVELGDMLFFPENATYWYRNVGDGDAYHWAIVGRVDEWPTSGKFYED
jgi:quercetin dioxygenase-like cupin family protein